ncbi:hypothetical protein HMPREF1554_02179 [Porphyromonas gingivalis F0569]|nr:hypothetical protein HMPREF1554_02179 [Porphyromonas gingivalis F0569]
MNFNCTIQELKPIIRDLFVFACEFQLHHTGIKTSLYGYITGLNSRISIAPYRN